MEARRRPGGCATAEQSRVHEWRWDLGDRDKCYGSASWGLYTERRSGHACAVPTRPCFVLAHLSTVRMAKFNGTFRFID
jgi:hypothetical protein